MDRERRRAESLLGRTLLEGRLRVERVLGIGGMGSVFEVAHLFTGHRRALKILHRSLRRDEEAIRRFHREATVAAKLNGEPVVVDTFDVGELEDGSHYILMELLEGMAVDCRLAAPDALRFELVRHIGEHAARGLAQVHRAGIIHRDIKPENLFLVGDRERPGVKLIDFGISKFLHGDEPMPPGTAVGTPQYMAPEQALGRLDEVDERSDIYSLGVTLYECLTDRLPFDASYFPAIVYAIHTGNRAAIRALRPDVPPGLEAIVDKAMHRVPAHRFASMTELAEALAGLSLAPVRAERLGPVDSRETNRVVKGGEAGRPSRNPRPAPSLARLPRPH